jgi:hypothetical protein
MSGYVNLPRGPTVNSPGSPSYALAGFLCRIFSPVSETLYLMLFRRMPDDGQCRNKASNPECHRHKPLESIQRIVLPQ